jgi:hypothetical protein
MDRWLNGALRVHRPVNFNEGDYNKNMDTSETYVKMADCPEIQDMWKPIEGDLARSQRSGVYVLFDSVIKAGELLGRFKHDHIWLPRQDQLQEMRTWDRRMSQREIIETFYVFISFERKEYYDQFNSMEQLWLAFVMKEKFSKTWMGTKWR